MSDSPHMSTGDWLGIGGLAATVVGSIVGSVKSMLGKRDNRITKLETGHYEQTTQLAVIHTNQDHMTNRLDEIRETTQDTNQKVGNLSDTLTTLLISIKSRGDRN